jgi:hypothetical protein
MILNKNLKIKTERKKKQTPPSTSPQTTGGPGMGEGRGEKQEGEQRTPERPPTQEEGEARGRFHKPRAFPHTQLDPRKLRGLAGVRPPSKEHAARCETHWGTMAPNIMPSMRGNTLHAGAMHTQGTNTAHVRQQLWYTDISYKKGISYTAPRPP